MLTNSEQRALLQELIARQNLSCDELTSLLGEAYTQSNDVLFTATLVALKTKGETPGDIFCVVRWLENNMVKIPNAPKNAIDICGTGGDTENTFNISTASAFVVAQTGIPVIKNGGRSNRGGVGSSDVLGELGIPLCKTPDACKKAMENNNLAFLDAPSFHPALERFRIARAKLGIPTILNIAAALANPACVKKRIIGVYSKDLVNMIGTALYHKSIIKHAFVVHGSIDEITICGKTTVAEVTSNSITCYEIEPSMFEMKQATIKDIRGGDARYNKQVIIDVLSGIHQGPCADVVALNAGAGIYVGGGANTLRDGVFMAKEILKSGKALKKLQKARVIL